VSFDFPVAGLPNLQISPGFYVLINSSAKYYQGIFDPFFPCAYWFGSAIGHLAPEVFLTKPCSHRKKYEMNKGLSNTLTLNIHL